LLSLSTESVAKLKKFLLLGSSSQFVLHILRTPKFRFRSYKYAPPDVISNQTDQPTCLSRYSDGLHDRELHSRQGPSNSSLLHSFQTSSWVHPAPAAFSLGAKRPKREADYTPPSSAEAKNDVIIPQFPNMSSWRSV
jgi:hypothetical protein